MYESNISEDAEADLNETPTEIIIDDKHWSGIITYRDQNIRIISVRRSRTEEIALYES